MKISFLTSGHEALDDRIFYHMAASLNAYGHDIEIVSSRSEFREVVEGIKLNCFNGENLSKREKTKQFIQRLLLFKPQAVICSEPLPLYAAHKYSKKQKEEIRVIYDITEWYPSRKNLFRYKKLFKWFFFLKLLLFNIWVSRFANSFIFGEWYKSRPYRILFPCKPFIFTSYYPDLKYIQKSPPLLQEGIIRLSYSGKISSDKGFRNFIDTINLLSLQLPDLKIEVKIIGWHEKNGDISNSDCMLMQTEKISVIRYDRQPFADYIDLIKDTDIFIDLREIDTENNNCLPIKLFYYTAFGRPVIFSNLKAIRREIEISSFGHLVNPAKTEETVMILIDYLNNRNKYYSHCNSARQISEERYNWKSLEQEFLKFITCHQDIDMLNRFRMPKQIPHLLFHMIPVL